MNRPPPWTRDRLLALPGVQRLSGRTLRELLYLVDDLEAALARLEPGPADGRVELDPYSLVPVRLPSDTQVRFRVQETPHDPCTEFRADVAVDVRLNGDDPTRLEVSTEGRLRLTPSSSNRFYLEALR